MRTKTAVVAATLLVAAIGSRALRPADADDRQLTAEAVRQFDDPAAADRLRELHERRAWADAGWLISCAGLTAVVVGAAVLTIRTRHSTPNREGRA